jgi:hypothetical protein
MNNSLLAKWRWKLLVDGNDLWKKVVVAKYGGNVMGNSMLEVGDFGVGASVWWRDIYRLDRDLGWFAQAVVKMVGNGNSTKFWKDVWLGNQPLLSRFSRLFGISVQKETLVCDMGRWENGVWKWELKWRRSLFVWEEGVVHELEDLLALVSLSEVNDC